MAEQSSTVVMFRALVMLFCLVAIPLAALFGSSLPNLVKSVQEGRWPTISATTPASAQQQSLPAEPAKFVPAGPACRMPTNGQRSFTSNSQGQAAAGSQSPSASWPGSPGGDQPGGVVPVGYETTARSGPSSGPTIGGSTPSAVRENRSEAAPPVSTEPAERVPGAAATTVATSSDAFTYVQDRLRQMGATYYVLESWGGQEQQYRFYCKMAVGGNPNYTRYFEAIDLDPLRAMTQVLEKVESWRSGRP